MKLRVAKELLRLLRWNHYTHWGLSGITDVFLQSKINMDLGRWVSPRADWKNIESPIVPVRNFSHWRGGVDLHRYGRSIHWPCTCAMRAWVDVKVLTRRAENKQPFPLNDDKRSDTLLQSQTSEALARSFCRPSFSSWSWQEMAARSQGETLFRKNVEN